MLKNDPPPGTRVRLTQEVRSPTRTIKAYEDGELLETLQPWTGEDRPSDQFLIRIGGEQITVRRVQIDKI